MNTRRKLLTLGVMSLFAAAAYAQDKTSSEDRLDGKKIELARYAKAFVGQGNVTVEVAPYKSGDKEGAILLFKGVESAWDGKALNHDLINGGADYATTYKGKKWVTLGQRDGNYTLYLPDAKEDISLAPSDGAAQLTNPRAIFQTYLEQKGHKK